MVKEISTYPTPPSVEFAVDVRVFDENIVSLIEDMKESIEANNLDGLSAFQIGSYYNVIVIKQEDGSFLEMINPRIISKQDKQTTTETTAYFPGLSAEVVRYDKISVLYQDRDAKDCSLKTEGALSVLIQRKIDYTHGATFLQKLTQAEKEKFETKLELGSDIAVAESCPTTFKRDKILLVIKYLMLLMFFLIVGAFFVEEQTKATLWSYQIYAGGLALVLNTIYFFYAQYEGKLYTSCSSCQLGNIIGTTAISLSKLAVIMLLSYFLVNPA